MRPSSLIPRTLILLGAILAAAAPAQAGLKDGWWVGLDGWFARPENLVLDPGVQFNTKLDDGGNVLSVPFDYEYSTRIKGGWRNPGGENIYSVSWWAWDHGSSLVDRTLVIPTLSDPVFTNLLSAKVDSDANLKTRITDFTISRKLTSTRRGAWYYGVGLRMASFRQNWDTLYYDIDPNNFTLIPEEKVGINVFSKGTGLTVGLGSSFQWAKRWRTTARAQVAMLAGETDASYQDKFVDPTGALFIAQLKRNNDRRVYQQIELEARVSYTVWKTLDVNLGYTFFQWNDAMEVARFFDDVQSAPEFHRDNIAYQGLTLGVSYWF